MAQDWWEHAPTLAVLAGSVIVAEGAALIGVVIWTLRKREEAIGLRITEGFDGLKAALADVAGRFDRAIDKVWASLEQHKSESAAKAEREHTEIWTELDSHRDRLEDVEVKCAGQHGTQSNGEWAKRSGQDRRKEGGRS